MIIERRSPRYPRRGPSCLLVILVGIVFAAGMYVVSNAEEVREAIIPTPTPEPTRSAAEYATSAALYERDGELENAIEAYEKAISLDATRVEYYMALIDLLVATNQPQEALERAEQAKVLAPENAEVWAAVAASHLANGSRLAETGDPVSADLQYQEAINTAEKATNLDPNNADAYAHWATGLAQLGVEYYQEALEKASLAVELAPESVTSRRAMATIFELMGRYDEAIEEYLIALDYNPNLVDLRIDLAYLFFFTDRRQEAILTLQDVLEIDPNNAAAYDGLGYFYFILGEYPRAEENAYEAVQLDPEMTRAHAHLGAAYFQQSKYDLAIQELEAAIADYETITPSNATYFSLLGLAYYRVDKDRCPEAVVLFEDVLAAEVGGVPEANALDGLEQCRQAQIESGP